MYSSVLVQVLFLAPLATLAFAVWKGDLAVRLGALIYFLLNLVALPAVSRLAPGGGSETAQVIEDLIGSMGFLFLAVRFANLWVGAVMLVQAGQFSLHAYYLVMELPHDRLHAWLTNSGDWLIIVCLVAGTVIAWRRRILREREEAQREALRQERASKVR
jgi:hypothetical protein